MGPNRTRNVGIGMLALGAMLVGLAIVLDGDAARSINGAGGLLWFASTAVLTMGAWRLRAPLWLWAVLAMLTVTVAFAVTPSALLPTVIGFVPAGFLVAWLAGHERLLWAALVPAWYLPAHIGTAVLKSAVRTLLGNEAWLRTDPPPTAAFVPLLMVVCALLGGVVAQRLRDRKSGHGGRVAGSRESRGHERQLRT